MPTTLGAPVPCTMVFTPLYFFIFYQVQEEFVREKGFFLDFMEILVFDHLQGKNVIQMNAILYFLTKVIEMLSKPYDKIFLF